MSDRIQPMIDMHVSVKCSMCGMELFLDQWNGFDNDETDNGLEFHVNPCKCDNKPHDRSEEIATLRRKYEAEEERASRFARFVLQSGYKLEYEKWKEEVDNG